MTVLFAGTYKTGSIKMAEAVKVIGFTLRDDNVALINELFMIVNEMKSTRKGGVKVAGTLRWSFFSFRPCLVGARCIGVDPYYLTRTEEMGYHPEVILVGGRVSDGIGCYISVSWRKLNYKKVQVEGARISMMGLVIKEDYLDLRNAKVVDIILSLKTIKLRSRFTILGSMRVEAQYEYGIRPVASV